MTENGKYTLEDVKKMDCDLLNSDIVCQVLGCQRVTFQKQYFADRDAIGFPVYKIGKNLRIPRLAFINCMEGRYFYGDKDGNNGKC